MIVKKHVYPAFLTVAYLVGMAIVVTRHDVKPVLAATCGDNYAEYGAEVCDGSDLRANSCETFGGTGTLGCNVSCTDFDYSGCYFNSCGDGNVAGGEQCDDGNNADGDGCSSSCFTEAPPEMCGNGSVGLGETCDDGNTTPNDGCNSDCSAEESGWICNGSPSVCTAACGDSMIRGSEACDDGNSNSYDGCDATCTSVESGYTCMGTGPGSCAPVCGDGMAVGGESCDDGNTNGYDGCDSSCNSETGYICSGFPSVCTTTCGDNVWIGDEACDDGNNNDGDGCDSSCAIEDGWRCNGTAYTGSLCERENPLCGNGALDDGEDCDDGNWTDEDGCSAECAIEFGFSCYDEPSICRFEVCGDAFKDLLEGCDDGNTADGDGCDALCAGVEEGWNCSVEYGEWSSCESTCGDGMQVGTESCDDGNILDGDGCSASCEIESVSSSSSSASSDDIPPSDPAASQGAGGGRGPSFHPPVASGRKANGVKSEEIAVPPGPVQSKEQWYTPALRDLQRSVRDERRRQGQPRPAALVAAAPMSRREIDELLAGIHWAACEEGSGPAADRKAKRLAAQTPDEERRRIMQELRMEKLSTRGAVMKRIAELLCLPMGSGSTPFKDLDPGSPYAPAIAALTRKELVTGYLDESGRPLDRIGAEDPISTAEIAVLLGRLRIPLD